MADKTKIGKSLTNESQKEQMSANLDQCTENEYIEFKNLKVDGGASNNNLLMQIQSNLLGNKVIRPKTTETTAIGAAFMAGLATGFWSDISELNNLWEMDKTFNPNLIKKMDDEESIIYLSSLRQVGRWSAEMILLFTFNRPNIWPVQDIGLLRAISNNYKKKYLPPKKFVNELKKKFSPYCSVATWYLWRSIDNEPIQY